MNNIIDVSQLNSYIKNILTEDELLKNILIRGEISNFKFHYSGHMYFALKDSKSKVKCVMFKGFNQDIGFVPEDGMKVIADGYISLYERDGQYQLYIRNLIPDGVGALHIAFEKLKHKLADEGLFDSTAKKPIPVNPRRIGVVTSAAGAAVRDIINVAGRRNPNIEILIVPVIVQGKKAPEEIAEAIQTLNHRQDTDVIIVGRGGGSIEELWAFNEEIVARSIYASTIPVISAVGHETDFTIADFVSDLRAPTPSAAAELAVPDIKKLHDSMKLYKERLHNAVVRYVESNKQRILLIERVRAFTKPYEPIFENRQYLDSICRDVLFNMTNHIQRQKERKNILTNKLNVLNPFAVLNRGYGIVRKTSENVIVRSVNQLHINENIQVRLMDGSLVCEIKQIIKGETECGK